MYNNLGPWLAPGINDNEARHEFSLNTCNGCHGDETNTPFLHISTRQAGAESQLSGFLEGVEVTGGRVAPARTRLEGWLLER